MRNLLPLIIVIIFNCNAQDVKFGKVSKIELEKSISEIDSNANAEFLYKKEHVYYSFTKARGFIQKRDVHLRIKIFNKEGLKWATHSIRLYNESTENATKIFDKKGYTFNLENGKIEKTKLSNDNLFEEKIDDFWKKVSFALPNVKEGSIIDLKYQLQTPFISIDDIYAQDLIPIKKLDVVVKIPEYFNFNKTINLRASFYPKLIETIEGRDEQIISASVSGTQIHAESYGNTLSSNTSTINFNENVTTIAHDNIPAIKENSYVDNIRNYIAKVVWEYAFFKGPDGTFKDYSSNWDKVSKTIYESDSFGSQLNKTGYFESDLMANMPNTSDTSQKIAYVLQFLKSRVSWNNYYGKYTIKGVRKAYKEGNGNVAEINLMLTAMLRHVGLDANPVLLSTKSHGIPLSPTIDGFNYVITAVELHNNVILIDGTDPYAIPNVLPKRVMNWNGRIIRKSGSSTWVSLEQKKAVIDSKSLNYEITSDLNIVGKITELKTLQLGVNERKKISKLSDEEKIKKIEDQDFDITIEDLVIKNQDHISKPLLKSFSFNSDELIEKIGDKIYISPLLFYTEEDSPFKEETRDYPIDFVYPFSNKFMVNIKIPDGYEIDHLPESSASSLSDDKISIYKYLIKQNGNFIQLNVSFDYKKSLVPSKDYKAFKSYYNSYITKLSDKIILKKWADVGEQ